MTSGFEVTDRAHSQTLLNCLDQQRIQGAFCDVTIVVEESKFRAHKNVLAASSLYFKERLSSWGPCGLQPVLELREVRAEVFAKILGFMYSSRLVVERLEQACELAAAGTHLGIPFLEELATPSPSLLPGAEDVLPAPLWRPERPFPTFPIDLTSPGNRQEGSVDEAVGPRVSPSHAEEEQEEDGGGEAGSMEESQKLYTLSTVAFQGLGFSVEEESEAGLGGDRRRPQEEEEGAAAEEEGDGQDQRQQQQEQREGEGPVTTETTTPTLGRPPALDLHLRLQREGRTLSCSHCHKTFVHVKRLQTHQALCSRRAGGLPSAGHQIQCLPEEPGSGRSLPDPRAEEEHFVKVVDGHLLYFCAVCQRSYMTLSSLKRHANVHSWRRRYPCRYCDKVFALAEYRTKHEVWHTGERRYQCIFCWDTFVTYYNLKTHQKAFHGVDPGLGISQKTPNGGYKPKLNAFKLYRLLPMRSQKRPYKTYSRLGQGASGCPLPGAESHPTPAGPPGPSTPAAPSSVITYGRTAKSSVIVHSKALPPAIPSSVIAYNGRCTGREEMGASDSTLDPAALPSPPPQIPGPLSQDAEPLAPDTGLLPQTLGPTLQEPGPLLQDAEPMAQDPDLPSRDTSLLPLTPRPPSEDHGSPAATDQRQEPRPQKPKRPVALGRPKTLTYMAKPACPSSSSLGSRPGPLCQITVRIGEEAIVKRRISESDLIRDKALTPCPGPGTSPGLGPAKGRRPEALPPGLTAKKLRVAEEDDQGCQPRPDDFLVGESADELSDQDTDDNLWRPYYSYKPKRRGAGLQRAKRAGWRRKLSLRPPGRFLHRAAKSAEAEAPGLAPRRQGGPEAEASAGDCLCSCRPEGKECPGCMACEGLVSPGERGLASPSSCDRAAGPPAGTSTPPSPRKKAPTWRTKALGRQRRRQQVGMSGLQLGAGGGHEGVGGGRPGPRTRPGEVPGEGTGQYLELQSEVEEEEEESEARPGWNQSVAYSDSQAMGGGETPGPSSPEAQPYPTAAAPLQARMPYAGAPEASSRAISDPSPPEEEPSAITAVQEAETELLSRGGEGVFGLDEPEAASQQVDEEGSAAFEGHGRPSQPDYPVQEFPLPLVTVGSGRSQPGLRHEVLDLQASTLHFTGADAVEGEGGLYPEPCPLVCGRHPLLAGAYGLGPGPPLPVALDMVIDHKAQRLPLLHRMFIYPSPCREQAHPLPQAPPLPLTIPLPLGASSTGSNHDEAGRQVLAGDQAGPMY
ncbi:zinc finger and BTB domain-containing protein 4-like [Mobula hypostoma]|uniref:zinc finger and BTB domain-containing protein 4-like n=1 Tax=Mobula hypostoma TaxID=723540 RepID=UPI002FC302E1